MRSLADQSWPAIPAEGATVLVPVGSTEQHGPHLPLDTDSTIASAVCERVAGLLHDSDLFVAPTVAFGSSGEHQAFPGTASIGTEALRLVLVELTRSLRTWAGRVIFVNGHGGNVPALSGATRQMQLEGHDVAWVPCVSEDFDLHAGRTETSLMLYLSPQRVRLADAAAGNTAPLCELWAALVAEGVRAVSPNGVLGDPSGANADEGARLLDAMTVRVAAQLQSRESEAQPKPFTVAS